jgi:sugar lactone lactonase YvrE
MALAKRQYFLGDSLFGALILIGAAFIAAPAAAQLTWSAQNNPSITDDIWCVTYGNDTFAAVTAQGNLLTSADGMTWASQTIDSGVWLVSIAYGNGIWVAVGANGTIMVSPDLKTWVSANAVTGNQLNGVAYGGGIWCAVGDSATVITSPDAMNWTIQTAPASVTGFLHGIVFGGYSSADNVTTEIPGFGFSGASAGNGSVAGTGVVLFMPVNAGQIGSVGTLYSTTANLEAIFETGGQPISATNIEGTEYATVAVGWGIVVSVPGGSNLGEQPTYASVPNVVYRGLTYGYGYWVAAGEQGTILSSTDGSTWQQSNSGSTATLLSAAYSSKLQRIVVTGMGGTILVANAPPPSITLQPISQSVDIQGSVSFSVTAGGAQTLTYQWFKNGSPISGATSPTLTLSNIQDSDAASYTVVVANDVGIATSNAATLTVLDIPVINGVPTTAPASIGLPFQLGLTILDSPSTVTVTGLPPGLTFDASTNTISGSPTTSGTYSVVINANNSFGSATPVTLSMSVGPTPLVFNTLAGGQTGSSDGTGTAAEFKSPNGLAIDSQGNLYVADTGNSTIRKVTASGVVTTIAGTAGMKGSSDGKGAAALFSSTTGIAVDGTGNLYVTDTGNNTIRKIDTTGQSSTIAGTPGVSGSIDNTGSAASFDGPTGVAVDSSGNLYVADTGNDTIRKIGSAGAVTTLAGLAGQSGDVDAFGIGARFKNPAGVALDSSDNVYVSDIGNFAIREISPTGSTSTVVVFPVPPQAGFGNNYYPTAPAFEGITIDSSGNIYADEGPVVSLAVLETLATESQILEITPGGSTSSIENWGGGGLATGTSPAPLVAGLVTDSAGYIYVLVNGVLEKSSSASGPTISTQPANQSAPAGQTVTFSVTANGNPSPSYQWFFNGSIISGATTSTLTLTGVTMAQAGSYSVSVSTPYTIVTSSAANLTVTAATTRLINISTRAQVGTGGNILIPGFVVSGSGTETLLIRADGPALAQFGVTGVLAKPSLSVYNSSGTAIASNTGWGTNSNPSQIASVASSVGAFALSPGSADGAIVTTLSAGAYTVQVSGVGNTTGVALAEVYEVSSSGTRLINISTRSVAGTGGSIIIAGFVVSGSGSEQLLVRGDGPSLTQFGVTGVLAQPTLSVISQGSGGTIASNTGWSTNSNPTQIESIAASVGAFSFAAGSADSAVVANLPAGAYTAQVSGVNNTIGVALVEVYEVP